MVIRAVIFDHGGVLSAGGTPGTTVRAVRQAMGMVGELEISDLDLELKLGEIDGDDYIYEINKRYPDAPRPLTEAIWPAIYAQLLPDPDAYDFASRCRAAGLHVGILSTVPSPIAAQLWSDGSYADFSPIILSCDMQVKKPDRNAWRMMELRLPGIARSGVLFLDDQIKNVAAAIKFGWHAVWVDREGEDGLGGALREATALISCSGVDL